MPLLADDQLEEFRALRGEIDRRSTVQHALVVLNLAAMSTLLGIAVKSSNAAIRADLALVLPFLSLGLTATWLDHHESIGRIGRYIRERLEMPHSQLGWETWGAAHPGRSHFYFMACAVVFAGPALASVLAGTIYGPAPSGWKLAFVVVSWLATAATAFLWGRELARS